jgi:hypothetical protein
VRLGDALRGRGLPASVLAGNPPWLAYRFMPADMQRTFRARSEERGLWHGADVATHQDLSGLFVARAVEIHLRPGGRFGFVMPGAVLDRAQFAGFRAGVYDGGRRAVRVAFEAPWDLRPLRPHVFPVGAAVVFGRREASAVPLPPEREVWSGRLPRIDAAWAEVAGVVTRRRVEGPREGARSPYGARFRNGATVVPRLLFMVEERGPVGGDRIAIRSARSVHEKRPWKDLPALEGVVEAALLCPVHLGETVLPYRVLAPLRAALPLGGEGRGRDPGLAAWWRGAERCWVEHRSSARLTLAEQLDYHGKLSAQLPVRPHRVVYAKSGMHLAAARLGEGRGVVDHTLYWATAASEAEAHYLCAVLNAAVVTRLVRPLMAYGKDERHVDKHVWTLPIPLFDAADARHAALSSLGLRAEEAVGALALEAGRHFAAARRDVRRLLAGSEVGRAIEALVEELLR